MTISEAATKYRYEGNAVTDTFAFSGKAFTANDLVVEIITRATDVLEETLTLTTDYSVTINTDGTASIVTVAGKIPDNTQDIQIRRDLELKQETALPVGTPFPAKSVEDALDRTVGIVQEQEEEVTRSLKFPVTSSTTVAILPEPVDNATILCDGTTGAFKIGPTSTDLENAEDNAAAAAASAAAAATSESNAASSASDAADSAAGVNLPSITATDTGSLLQVNAAGTAHELLAPGTSGQYLQSNGNDAALSWSTISQDFAVLETQTASSSSELDFTSNIDSTYKIYELHLIDVLPASVAMLEFFVSTDGGSSFETGASDYSWGYVESNGASGTSVSTDTADDSIPIVATNLVATASAGVSGKITIYNPAGTTANCSVHATGMYQNTGNQLVPFNLAGRYVGGTTAVDAFRLKMNGGVNIATGIVKLIGIK